MMENILRSENERRTEQIAASFAQKLLPGDIIAFSGGLGAGKTAFVRGLAEGLGSPDAVSSPTFALINEYHGGKYLLYHFDLYRLHGFDDLYSIGFFDLLEEENAVFAIEWSENAREFLPEERVIEVKMESVSENERKITIAGGERFAHFGD